MEDKENGVLIGSVAQLKLPVQAGLFYQSWKQFG